MQHIVTYYLLLSINTVTDMAGIIFNDIVVKFNKNMEKHGKKMETMSEVDKEAFIQRLLKLTIQSNMPTNPPVIKKRKQVEKSKLSQHIMIKTNHNRL